MPLRQILKIYCAFFGAFIPQRASSTMFAEEV
jgi:hypothetical protein